MTSFGTDANGSSAFDFPVLPVFDELKPRGFSRTFPGLAVHLLGHNAIFRIPLFREWCLVHGHGAVGRETCLYLLRRGESIALAPGGGACVAA